MNTITQLIFRCLKIYFSLGLIDLVNKKILSLITRALNVQFNRDVGKEVSWYVKVRIKEGSDSYIVLPISFNAGYNSVKFIEGKTFSFIYMDLEDGTFDIGDITPGLFRGANVDSETIYDVGQSIRVARPTAKSVANKVNKEFDSTFEGETGLLPLFSIRNDGTTIHAVVGTSGMRSYSVYMDRYSSLESSVPNAVPFVKYFFGTYGTKSPTHRPDLFLMPLSIQV